MKKINVKEDLNNEFKRELPKPNKILKEISAFCNTEGGTIYLGINDEGEIIHNASWFDVEKIASSISTSLEPSEAHEIINNLIKFESMEIDCETKKIKILAIRCKKSDFPIGFFKKDKKVKKYFQRLHANSNPIELNQLELKFNEISETNQEYYENTFSKLANTNPLFANKHILKSFKLIKNSKLTNLGKLFCDEPISPILCDFIEYSFMELPKLFLLITNKLLIIKTISLKRDELKKLINIENINAVMRELIINSSIHSLFNNNIILDIKIYLNEYYFSIDSPFINTEFMDMLDKNDIFHSPVNYWRNKIFKELKYCELHSRGYHDIIKNDDQNYYLIFIVKNYRLKMRMIFRHTVILKYGKLLENNLFNMFKNGISIKNDKIFENCISDMDLKDFIMIIDRFVKTKKGVKLW